MYLHQRAPHSALEADVCLIISSGREFFWQPVQIELASL